MSDSDESIPDEIDEPAPAPRPATAHPPRSAPAAALPPRMAQPVAAPPPRVAQTAAWQRLRFAPLPVESIYEFMHGARASAKAPKRGLPEGPARASIVHKRAVREEVEDGADESRWDERAPRAKYEHVPMAPCRYFNTPGGCTAAACPFAHVEGAAPPKQTERCKFFESGKCLRGEQCSFLHE
ncbi:hypothetical protein T492DRAFT_994651 [Pavlovales sp. CCMP2436]|nr:hypothetical protein T492DRAFT_994651 [Pavlovales sp. CCMP2436]